MKKYRNGFVSVMLMLAMVLGSFSFTFGANDGRPGAVGTINILGGYNEIQLTWKPVANTYAYEIERSVNNGAFGVWNRIKDSEARINSKTVRFRDRKATTAGAVYKYRVRAYVVKNGKRVYSAYSPTVGKKLVKQMYQTIYLKNGDYLYSHAGGSQVRRYFSSSKPIIATGFGGGKFKFWDGKGSNRRLFYAHYTRVRKASGDYWPKYNYDNNTAEYFVNNLQREKIISKSKKSNYLIWVSTISQHLYIYKWDSKNRAWKLYNHWDCSTGEPCNPTIISLKLKIQFKDSYNSNIPWWNCFSGYNAIHGKRSHYKIDGKPHSHGCVRNYNQKAEWIYKHCPVGTPVVIY